VSIDALVGPFQVPFRGRHPLAAAGLVALVVLAIVLRLVPILFVPSLNWADEIFQATEQAHRLVYGTGLVPWEFQLGARSWLLPGFIAALMELARLAGDGPDYYLPLIAGAFGTLGAAPVVCSFLWCHRLFGLTGAFVAAAVVAVAPELIYFGARTLSEVLAGHLLIVGLYMLEPGYQVTSRRRLFVGGALLGLVFVVRIQLAPTLVVVALWTNWHAVRERVLSMLSGVAAALTLAAILDTATIGYPLASLWRYVQYNVYYRVSSSFGVEPWYYYLGVELGVWRDAVVLLLLLALLGARRLPLLFAVAVTILAVHSSIPHKEYRFIYPALVPLMLLAGTGLAEVARCGTHWLRVNASQPSAMGVSIASALGVWALVSFSVWTGSTLAGLRDSAHDNLLAASFVAHGPAPCGIGIYGLGGDGWAAYGGYTYFHRSAPMYWPKDEAALIDAAGGFDMLLYTQPTPKGLGFSTLRCIGEVCVAQRLGGCRPVPVTPIPVLDALVEAVAKTTSSQASESDGNGFHSQPSDSGP
jgi:GPI mannosyltransferase 3